MKERIVPGLIAKWDANQRPPCHPKAEYRPIRFSRGDKVYQFPGIMICNGCVPLEGKKA